MGKYGKTLAKPIENYEKTYDYDLWKSMSKLWKKTVDNYGDTTLKIMEHYIMMGRKNMETHGKRWESPSTHLEFSGKNYGQTWANYEQLWENDLM